MLRNILLFSKLTRLYNRSTKCYRISKSKICFFYDFELLQGQTPILSGIPLDISFWERDNPERKFWNIFWHYELKLEPTKCKKDKKGNSHSWSLNEVLSCPDACSISLLSDICLSLVQPQRLPSLDRWRQRLSEHSQWGSDPGITGSCFLQNQ